MANPNEQAEQSPKASKVIIAVNTPDCVGYFVDNEGDKLFNKQFEEVNSFHEGLAPVEQNGKYSKEKSLWLSVTGNSPLGP